MRRDPASVPVRPAGQVLAAVHRPRDRTVAAKVAPDLLVEGMAMMDDDVHAWARERLADVIYECDDDADAAADAVLAVLPELLTDQRILMRAWAQANTGSRQGTERVLRAAAEALAGSS